MSMTASQILDLIAPGYKTDPDKASFLVLAQGQTSSCAYGSKYNQAVALRAAHMMTLRDRALGSGNGDGGSVASKKEGDIAISYNTTTNSKNDDLSQTSYGRQLLGLSKGVTPFMGVTGGLDSGC